MQKELSNDQRARLEQIARDEFRIRRDEVSKERNEVYTAWTRAESDKVMKSKLFKDYVKAKKDAEVLFERGRNKGFEMIYASPSVMRSGKNRVQLISDSYDGRVAYPGVKKKMEETRSNPNDYTRALNAVLSVIWSMEKPFKECMALIHKSVKSIK